MKKRSKKPSEYTFTTPCPSGLCRYRRMAVFFTFDRDGVLLKTSVENCANSIVLVLIDKLVLLTSLDNCDSRTYHCVNIIGGGI